MKPFGKQTIGTIAYMGGVPAVLEPFCWAWGQLIQYNSEYLIEPGQTIFYDKGRVSYHAASRNQIVDSMRGDWLLMLDTDHEPPPDLAARMVFQMLRHDIDVLSALYVYKHPPYNPVLFTRDKDGRLGYLGDWDRSATIFDIGSSGGGALLVRRRVFDRIRDELHENPFEIRKQFSEDNSFYDRCFELKIQTWCCPMIESPHLAIERKTLEHYQPDRSLIGPRFEVDGRV